MGIRSRHWMACVGHWQHYGVMKNQAESVVHLRAARLEDAEAIEAVRVEGWRLAYRGIMSDAFLDGYTADPEHRRRRMIEGSADNVAELVAEDVDSRIVGWIVASPADRDDDLDPSKVGEIDACYVATSFWGCGIGRELMSAALVALADAGYGDVTLWVLRDNVRARAFYESLGFRPDGHEKTHDFAGVVTSVRYRRHAGSPD